MLPNSAKRVPMHTALKVNEEIKAQTESNVEQFASGRESIEKRLEELDREWDIERMLEANAASLAFIGVALGATVSKKWLAVPALVTGFLLQHALQGWCPPVPLLRRLGFRTRSEIDEEKFALKALRGDFSDIPGKPEQGNGMARKAIEAARR